jgi:hypothetical protein
MSGKAAPVIQVITGKKPINKGQFKKGDKRINRKGRPRNFDALRRLGQSIATEVIPDAKNVEGWTRIEMILRDWASSSEQQLQRAFVEIAYGKVPDETKLDIKGTGVKTYITVSPDDWNAKAV